MAATSSTSHTQPAKSQYHHFIPRFILRNFVHPPNRPTTSSKQSQKGAKRSRKGGRNYNEPMIYAVDLSKPTAEIIERPVSRTFGMTDMYRDFKNSKNEHYLEEELSKLESRAGEVVGKMRKHFEEGKPEVWITRPERNTLRKFLFIMKYRNSRQHKRFYHQNAQGYSENDREKLLRYMDEKGFRSPVDVWFDNIKGMLELKMDVKDQWIEDLPTRIYPDDARWYISHTQMMYLALCTPTNEDEEFLLTENAYGIYEGPSSVITDPATGKIVMEPYTEFHKFAVISPKLMMVLRSFLLPVPEEDLDEKIKSFRETMFKYNAIQHTRPFVSSLADLPITKARNSYSRIVDGRVQPLEGRDSSHRIHDKFCFRFFPLKTEHVGRINAIMLEESYNISNIVFKSHSGLRTAVEHYLAMPTTHGFKVYDGMPNDPRLCLLKKIEHLIREMGSDATAVYEIRNQEQYEKKREEIFAQILERNLETKPSESIQPYFKLGGSPKAIGKDVEQAERMLNMRIKIDVFTQGLNEDFREGVRDEVRELFCQLPPRRVWFYLKRVRVMLLRNRKIGPNNMNATTPESNLFDNGPEDAIARGISHIFRDSTSLCRLMWHGTLKHIEMIKNPDINFNTIITLDEKGAHNMNLQRHIFFGPLGSICDCGIPSIEERAKLCKDMARSTPYLEAVRNPFWKAEENIEMATRYVVRKRFAELMGSEVAADEVGPLEEALFDFIYPTGSGNLGGFPGGLY